MGGKLYNWFFSTAENKCFADYERETFATVARSFIWVMVLLYALLQSGLIGSVDSSVDFVSDGSPLVDWFLKKTNISLPHAFGSAFATFQFLGTIVFAPFLEELVFRALPCALATDATGKLRPRIGVPIILVGSFFAFGYVHGQGYLSMMIQGVLGLFLMRLFLRNGPKLWVSYLSCVVAHAMYNLLSKLCHWNYSSH